MGRDKKTESNRTSLTGSEQVALALFFNGGLDSCSRAPPSLAGSRRRGFSCQGTAGEQPSQLPHGAQAGTTDAKVATAVGGTHLAEGAKHLHGYW